MRETLHKIEIRQLRSSRQQILYLTLALLTIAIYSLLRYRGMWGETDTAGFTQSISSISMEGTLIPVDSLYANGYGYSALGLWIHLLSGLSIPHLQLYLAILLAPWVILPAWLFFREITSSARAASLACLILLTQPEFLFPLLRGTHEKFTRGLMLICLYLLIRSLRDRTKFRQLIGFTITFYLCGFGLITFNVFQATSLIAAVVFAWLLCWLAAWWLGSTSPLQKVQLKSVGYKIISLVLLVFLFMFYAYPPAQDQIRILNHIADQLFRMFFGFEPASTNPYLAVNQGWLNLPVYFILSLSNWLLLLASAFIWLSKTRDIVRRRNLISRNDLLLWGFFGAFAFQGMISIAVDVSGSLSANLQHRLFPSFVLLAAPIIARWIVDRGMQHTKLSRSTRVFVSLAISALVLLAVLKATNEPALSNKWNFHLPGEAQAVKWASQVLPDRGLWTGFDERVNVGLAVRQVGMHSELVLDQYDREPETRNLLVSDITRQRSLRIGQPLPLLPDDLAIYDNGAAQIYHLRPRTPFQK